MRRQWRVLNRGMAWPDQGFNRITTCDRWFPRWWPLINIFLLWTSVTNSPARGWVYVLSSWIEVASGLAFPDKMRQTGQSGNFRPKLSEPWHFHFLFYRSWILPEESDNPETTMLRISPIQSRRKSEVEKNKGTQATGRTEAPHMTQFLVQSQTILDLWSHDNWDHRHSDIETNHCRGVLSKFLHLELQKYKIIFILHY